MDFFYQTKEIITETVFFFNQTKIRMETMVDKKSCRGEGGDHLLFKICRGERDELIISPDEECIFRKPSQANYVTWSVHDVN